MNIELTPQFSGNTLSISRDGEMLVINGQPHDFSEIPVGGSVGMVGKIMEARRDETGLTVRLILPHGADADESVRFPAPIPATKDGPIAVPGQDAPEPHRTAVFVVPYSPPAPPPVPAAVTMRQARLALLGAGKLADVATAIDSLPEPNKSVATIEWEYSQEVHRDRALIQVLGPMLGLDDAQMDALFVTAAAL